MCANKVIGVIWGGKFDYFVLFDKHSKKNRKWKTHNLTWRACMSISDSEIEIKRCHRCTLFFLKQKVTRQGWFVNVTGVDLKIIHSEFVFSEYKILCNQEPYQSD